MTKEQKQPYVRFFASDWLAGTRGMRAAETGVYVTLIALMYERCEPLPEDHRRLARQCGVTPQALKPILEMLVSEGKILRSDQGLWNERVGKEFEWRTKNSQDATKAANVRWEKDKENNGSGVRTHSDRNADAMPSQKPEARSQKPEDSAAYAAGGKPPTAYRFAGHVVRLNERDYAAWEKAYSHLDLPAELLARDIWLSEQGFDVRKRWFGSTSKYLANRNAAAKADAEQRRKGRTTPLMQAVREAITETEEPEDDCKSSGDRGPSQLAAAPSDY